MPAFKGSIMILNNKLELLSNIIIHFYEYKLLVYMIVDSSGTDRRISQPSHTLTETIRRGSISNIESNIEHSKNSD